MRKGFSLVELSMVLVIVGLLVGGILAGQSLIQAGRIRGTLSDIQQITTAAGNYVAKYNAFPGDHNDAYSYFGAACAASAAACNGDNTGLVDNWTNEYAMFWRHLDNAGLLRLPDGETGLYYRPRTKIDNTVLYAYKDGYYWATGPGRNSVTFTRLGTQGATWNEGGLIPELAWQIDRKIDDGIPGSGAVRGFNGYDDATSSAETCLSGTDYAITNTSTQTCWVVVPID